MAHERELMNPAWLPAWKRVGSWRALERRSRGTYGKADADGAPVPVPRMPGRKWRLWLAAACVGVALVLGTEGALHVPLGNESAPGFPEPQVEAERGGTVAVGDTALMAPVESPRAPSVWGVTAPELPLKPLPGQFRPDARGRCPRLAHVAINGSCWKKLAVDLTRCDEGYEYKGGCYVPAYPPPRVPTSSPAEPSRDGG